MFIDEVIITVKAGNGGDGSAAFRREKFVQFGGPDGGDGGKGGDVIFIADSNINTLIDFKFKKLFKAQNGENGQKKQMYGKKGEDLIIKVPVGTQVRDFTTGKLILDMSVNGEQRVLLKGGKGGYGNIHFKNSIRKAPKIAEKGGEGAEIKEADFSPQDFDFLNAMDEIRNTTAAVMNVPSILIGDRTNSKFSNYKEAKKDLYTENILPLVEQIAEYLNNIMKDKLESNEYIDFDTSTIGVLKEDRKEKMAMLNNLSYLTINEKRAELEYPPVENGDDILISTSMTPLKEIYEDVKPVEEEDDAEETESSEEENEES